MTTVDLSLDKLISGQMKFINQFYDVVGAAADTGLLQKVAEREGVRVVDIPMHREINILADIRSLCSVYKFLRKEKPWILHCNTPKGSLLGMIAGWAARVPNRVYLVTGLRYQGAHGVLRFILKTMERISCLFATKVIPEGQGVLHTLKTDHITGKTLSVLHHGNINGIDTDFFSNKCLASDMGMKPDDASSDADDEKLYKELISKNVRKRLGLKGDDFVFVSIGRLVKDKGINELALCMKQLDCRLILVGSFDENNAIDDEAKEFLTSSDRVKCVGWQEDVRPYLAAADALVFPSYREGFPNVPIQAGAMGLPCIVTDINGSNEIIKDNLNGKIIVSPSADNTDTPSAMEKALESTMEWFISHPAEVERMSRNARRMITSRYEQKDVWKAILDMYNSL